MFIGNIFDFSFQKLEIGSADIKMGKMKDSSLLRWTQTKNNNNTDDVDNKQAASTEKKEKKPKKEKQEKSKKWLHKSENLTSGHIAYLVKVR